MPRQRQGLMACCLVTLIVECLTHGLSVRHAEQWAQASQRRASIRVDDQCVGDVLGPLLDHNFTMPLSAMRKGLTYVGNNHRLRRAVHTLMSGGHSDGRPFKVAVIGGSIAWGQGATRRGENDWFTLVSRWFQAAFPKVVFQARNGAVPATRSGYMTMCLDLFTDNDTDIMFAEYNLNDGFDDHVLNNPIVATYERLIRRVVSRGPQPPMIMLQVPSDSTAKPFNNSYWRPFHHTMEGLKSELAEYYDLPVLSFRTAMYRLANELREPGLQWRDVLIHDLLHPSDKGCRLILDLVVWLIQQTALDLVLHPYGFEDVEMLAERLPRPMIPGNEMLRSVLCAHQDGLHKFVRQSDTHNFTFANDGTVEKPRKGYSAITVGAVLTLQVDTKRGSVMSPSHIDDSTGSDPVRVYLAHLRSYQHMGMALASCVSGCTCAEKVIDAHHTERTSQLFLSFLTASQHRRCTIAITVLSNTTSGEHRFKVGGLMLSEGNDVFDMDEGPWGYGELRNGIALEHAE